MLPSTGIQGSENPPEIHASQPELNFQMENVHFILFIHHFKIPSSEKIKSFSPSDFKRTLKCAGTLFRIAVIQVMDILISLMKEYFCTMK